MIHDFETENQLGQCEPPECYPTEKIEDWHKLPPPKTGDEVWTHVVPEKKGTIGPVNVECTHWDYAKSTYVIAGGDTLSGLAYTYLLDPARWRELWDEQPLAYRQTHSPDKIYPGQVWPMPDEARTRARAICSRKRRKKGGGKGLGWGWIALAGGAAAAAVYALS